MCEMTAVIHGRQYPCLMWLIMCCSLPPSLTLIYTEISDESRSSHHRVHTLTHTYTHTTKKQPCSTLTHAQRHTSTILQCTNTYRPRKRRAKKNSGDGGQFTGWHEMIHSKTWIQSLLMPTNATSPLNFQ